MATRPTIRLRLKSLTYSDLATFAQSIHDGFVAQVAHYATPLPTMPNFQTAITNLLTAVTVWGTTGNRGSHASLVDLKAKALIVQNMLTQLAEYAMNLDPYDDTFWVLVGFENKSPGSPVGIIQKVQDLRQFISRTVLSGNIKISWIRPLAAPVGGVKSYKVYRFDNPGFNPNAPYATVTKTTFTDDGNSPLGIVDRNTLYFYYVIPVGAAGDGVISDVLMAQASGVPQ